MSPPASARDAGPSTGERRQSAALLGLGLTAHEVFWSAVVLRFTISVSLLPVLTASRAGRDAWAAALAGTLLGLALSWILTYPVTACPSGGIARQHREALGRWLGPGVTVAYLWILLHLTALTLRDYAEAVVTAILPTTPLVVVVGLTTLLAGVAAGRDTPSLGRMAIIIGGVMAVSVVAVALAAAPVARVARLAPLFRTGPPGLVSGALVSAAWHSMVIFLLPMAPSLVDRGEARRAVLAATVVSGLAEAAVAALVVFVMSGELGVKAAYPLFEVVRQVEVGEFLQRPDALVIGAWGLGLIMSAALLFHAGARGLAQLADLRGHSVLVKPMMVVLATLAFLLAANDLEIRRFSDARVLTPYLGVVLWLPASAVALGTLRAARRLRRSTRRGQVP